MTSIHATCVRYGRDDDDHVNYESGANIAGFVKVADAMLAQRSASSRHTRHQRSNGSQRLPLLSAVILESGTHRHWPSLSLLTCALGGEGLAIAADLDQVPIRVQAID